MTDKERLENIKEQYQWAVENRLANRVDDSDIDWLIEQAEQKQALELTVDFYQSSLRYGNKRTYYWRQKNENNHF